MNELDSRKSVIQELRANVDSILFPKEPPPIAGALSLKLFFNLAP